VRSFVAFAAVRRSTLGGNMPIRVVSKRAGGTKPEPHEVVINIARPSVLGNPYHMKHEHQRDHVIREYKRWLEARYNDDASVFTELHAIAERVKDGEYIALECWCAPCACHGDVIIEAVEFINNGDTNEEG
jgi:hypothetical protein